MEVEAGAGSEVVAMEVEAGAGSEVVAMEVMEMKEAAEAAEAAKLALGTAEADCSVAAAQSATEEPRLAPVMSRRGLLQLEPKR